MALMLSECRILYENRKLCEVVLEKKGEEIKKHHLDVKAKTQHQKVKECVDDVLSLLFK